MNQNWDNFLKNLKESKQNKEFARISAVAIVNLIYGGSFDEECDIPKAERIEAYEKMFDDVKSALGSEASLPKKTKTQAIGLNEVRTDVELEFWRSISNFTYSADITRYFKEQLKMRGFYPINPDHWDNNPFFPKTFTYKRMADHFGTDKPMYLCTNWNNMRNGNLPKSTLSNFIKEKWEMAILGYVSKNSERIYQGNKKMLVVDMFIGSESVTGLIMWPKKNEYEVRPTIAAGLKPGKKVLVKVRPTIYKGELGGTIVGVMQIREAFRDE